MRLGKVWLWLWIVLLAGCQEPPLRALKVATNQWIGYEPLYLARYIGAFEQNVDVIQLPSATDVMRALRNGNVDVAATTLDEALLLASQGEQLVVLMAFDFSNGADVVLARPPIASLEEIKGKRVGVENTGLGAVMLSAALTHVGYNAEDVTLVNLSVDQHEAAYTNNEVDVVVTFEPVATKLRQAGANVLFDSSAVPDLIVDVLVARRSALEQQPAAVIDLMAGYYRARHYMSVNPTNAMRFIGKRMQLSNAELQKAFAGLHLPSLQDNLNWLSGAHSPFDTVSGQLQQLMQARHLLDHSEHGQLQSGLVWLEKVQP